VVHGLAIMASTKHSRQPFIVAELLTTNSPPCATSFLPVPVVSGQRKSARSPPPAMEVAHVRYQYLRCACGSDRIGSGVCARLESNA
jgi:hypothetical protein